MGNRNDYDTGFCGCAARVCYGMIIMEVRKNEYACEEGFAMKKLLSVLLVFVMLLMIPVVSGADMAGSRQMLEEYTKALTGNWKLYHYDSLSDIMKLWEGMPKELKITKTNLSINALGQVYHIWSITNFKGNGGEVLLTGDENIIGLVFTSNGITTIAYYERE